MRTDGHDDAGKPGHGATATAGGAAVNYIWCPRNSLGAYEKIPLKSLVVLWHLDYGPIVVWMNGNNALPA